MSVDRVPVDEAARRLGIKAESIRKRIYRGSLKADKEPDGRLMVYLDATDEVHGRSTDEVHGHESDAVGDGTARLIEHLEAEIEFQRRESERKDAIIMQLSQANAEQARTIRELEAPREPPEAPAEPQNQAQEPEQGNVGAENRAEPESGSERRSWLRRIFGG